MNPNIEQVLQLYMTETVSLLEQFDNILLEVKNQQFFSSKHIDELFRILHTLKGSSSMMEFTSITELSHTTEDIFTYIQTQNIDSFPCHLQNELLHILLSFSDFLHKELKNIEEQQVLFSNIDHFIIKIKNFYNKIKEDEQESEGLSLDIPSLFHLSSHYRLHLFFPEDQGMEAARALLIVTNLKQLSFSFHHYPSNIESFNRSYLEKNGLFLSFQTEMEAINAKEYLEKNMGIQCISLLSPVQPSPVRSSSPTETSLPLSLLFDKMELFVQKIQTKLNKNVELITSGSEIAITKQTFDALNIACIHLIRNAIDHGIEPTSSERLMLHKKEVGTLSLLAKKTNEGLSFTIQDDGKGIDTTSILKIAQKSGILTKAPSFYTKEEVFNLLFLPGLSTAKTISEFSGRGIGMDIVLQTISALGGNISITSMLSQGTAIHITLPKHSLSLPS